MAYRYRRAEKLGSGTKRIARELVDRTSRLIADSSIPMDVRIHEARKAIKKLRALLRLVRPAFEADRTYSDANAFLRDTSRILSTYRDDDVVRQTADQFAGNDAETKSIFHIGPPEEAEVHGRKLRRRAIEKYRKRLLQFRNSIDGWRFRSQSLNELETGYQTTLGKARRWKTKAFEKPSEGRMHRWRKQVKNHGYHTALLANLDNGRSKSRIGRNERLQELLGLHHDIALLENRIKQSVRTGMRKSAIRSLRARIKRSSLDIEDDVRTLGAELF